MMADLTPQTNADLNRLAEIRAKGELVDAIDEQRLRDHQLRRLRRLWLKDQCLTDREPLLPPKKQTLYSRFKAKEDSFWSRHLKFRTLPEYLYHGKDFNQIPKLWTFQFLRFARNTFLGILTCFPGLYILKYGGWDQPCLTVESVQQILPGDRYMTVRRGDVKFDRSQTQFVPAGPDDWQNVLK